MPPALPHHPSPLRPTGRKRATDYLLGSVLATVLVVGTACGAGTTTTAEAPAPASATQTQAAPTDAAATPAAATASAAPDAAVPTSPADSAPLDPTQAPAAPGANLAANQQPAYATKAVDLLETLPIKGRAPQTGYSREQFGPAWADADHNGCDTRNDILLRDLSAVTFKAGTKDCVVLSGTLADPYTGRLISFTRGAATSTAVQIDHVVALNDAWQKGAQQLSLARRTELANDPLNLLAVDGPTNQQKGAGDAATWLPPNTTFRCDYVARQISVKATYRLWVTQAEHDTMAHVLAGCGNTVVPTNRTKSTPAPVDAAPAPAEEAPAAAPPAAPAPVVPAPVAPAPAAADDPAPVPAPAPAPAVPDAVAYYPNCAAARAAGAAPLHIGEPGYAPKLDRDGDGVACE